MEGYVGQIILFSGNKIPNKWVECDGRALNVEEYSLLSAVMGLDYDDHSLNFKIPNLPSPVEGVMYIICYDGLFPAPK